MPERIPATAWFPPQELADCSVCREAQAALTPGGLAGAGDLALAFLARGQAVPLLAGAAAHLPPPRPGRVPRRRPLCAQAPPGSPLGDPRVALGGPGAERHGRDAHPRLVQQGCIGSPPPAFRAAPRGPAPGPP